MNRGGSIESDRSILFVVDTDSSLKFVAARLTQQIPCRVVFFPSAEELLDSADFRNWAKELGSYGPGIKYLLTPVCLVSEFRLPRLDGLQLMRWLAERQLSMPTIFATNCRDVRVAANAVRLGAMEILTKPVDVDVLTEAIRSAMLQAPCLRTFERNCHVQKQRMARLSNREKEVLEKLLRGCTLKRIAVELGTSPNTVRNQRSSILRKLEAKDDIDLVVATLSARTCDDRLQRPLWQVLASHPAFAARAERSGFFANGMSTRDTQSARVAQ